MENKQLEFRLVKAVEEVADRLARIEQRLLESSKTLEVLDRIEDLMKRRAVSEGW